jgi:hypothetical protein
MLEKSSAKRYSTITTTKYIALLAVLLQQPLRKLMKNINPSSDPSFYHRRKHSMISFACTLLDA